jgi:hypothetical protein
MVAVAAVPGEPDQPHGRQFGQVAETGDLASSARVPSGRGTSGKSAPEGIRTPNLLIRSQTLYPLSYGRWSMRPGHECTGRLRRLENERAVRFETDLGAEPAADAAQGGS